MDTVEYQLKYIEDKLREAWIGSKCLTCPIGELAAIAAAVSAFYRENRGLHPDKHPDNAYNLPHWSTLVEK